MPVLEEWLTAIGLGHHAGAFRGHDIDLADLAELTEDDLREIGLSMGERKRFLRALSPASQPTPLPSLPTASHPMAERRHLTVLFSDIVGSSALAERLDAEDVLDAMHRYQRLVGDLVERFGGHVAKFLGDGVVAWFGYPTASESDAECALLAALEITRAIGGVPLPDGGRLRVRIGIATGPVVIGDLIGSGTATEHPIAGVTPNLAARLQNLAPPNGVVVSDDSWSLTASRFHFEDMGAHALQGFSQPVRVWRVRSERRRGDAGDRVALVPLVDRRTERALLRELWRQAREVTGAVLLVRGEPGIGKSRLIEEFLEGAGDTGHWTFRLQASQVNGSNPLCPVIAEIERFTGIDRLDPPATRLAKLDAFAFGEDAERAEVLRVMASLLSIRHEEESNQPPLSPRQLKELTLRTLVRQLCLAAEDRPVILLVEDMHWLDPTTVELLNRQIDTARGRRLFIIVTSREPFPEDWKGRPGVHALDLPKLAVEDCAAMVRSLTTDRPLDRRTQTRILERTDGIPLFVEELTRTLVEAKPTAPGTRPDAIPISLEASLMARLDRAGTAKELAQAGSVLGRSFDHDLLSRVSEFRAEDLDDALAVLIRADLIHGDGDLRYSFKHALVQDAAYASLLRDRRRALHARAAAALLDLTPEAGDLRPDLLAHHYDESAQVGPAIDYLLKAARRALDRSAMAEAENHLTRALALTAAPYKSGLEEKEALDLRMEILVLLGPVRIFLRGPGSPDVERLYAEAYELCRQLPETSRHFPISWGWWRLSRDFTVMGQRADALLERASERADDGMLLQAHHCQWASHFNRGDLARCRHHIDHGLAIYEAGDYREHASLYGNHDAKVCGHAERALVLWLAGDAAAAQAEEGASLAWAAGLGHTGSRAHALDASLTHQFYRRDTGLVLARAADMIALAEEQNFPDHRAKGLLYAGWAIALRGEPKRGLDQVRVALARQKAIGTPEDFPVFHCMLADVLAGAGKPEEALAELIAAREEFERIGLKIWAPEVERQIGEMTWLSGSADDAAVEAAFRRAQKEARRQGALALELRAVNSIATLWERQGRADEAFDLLRRMLHRVPPTAANPDLETAREGARRLSARLRVGWPR
jgi:predicted ATPase/class 3 adenylate cyclase